MIDARTVQQTLSMFDEQNLDIRTVTLGISLQSCVSSHRQYRESNELAAIRAAKAEAYRDDQLTLNHAALLEDVDAFALAIFSHITSVARDLVYVVDHIAEKYGIKIANRRLSVTPIGSLVSQFFTDDQLFGGIDSYETFKQADSRKLIEEIFFTIAFALDEACSAAGVDISGGFSALVSKGMTRGENFLLYSIPSTLAKTRALCA